MRHAIIQYLLQSRRPSGLLVVHTSILAIITADYDNDVKEQRDTIHHYSLLLVAMLCQWMMNVNDECE
jgi:hypothetical protein